MPLVFSKIQRVNKADIEQSSFSAARLSISRVVLEILKL